MSFAEPLHLLALLVVPLVALAWLAAHRRRRRFAVRHPATSTLAAALGRAPQGRWRRVLPPALLGLAAVALALAYARPQHTVQVPQEQASVMLVTDESGSMAADDVAPSRLRAAQDAARAFLSEAPKELQVGFSSYSSGVRAQLDPTTQRAGVKSAIDGLQADGGTATGDALSAALDRLQARKGTDGQTAPAAVVLLSDGATSGGSDPLAAAARAKQLGIPVYTVALGTSEGVVSLPDGRQLAVPPDPDTLAQIAEASGGQSYETADADQLDGVYRDLGSKIGTEAEEREISTSFALGGLVLLVGGLAGGLRFRGRLV